MISNENYKIASGGEGFIIRRASRFEINFAIEAAASEGWNPGLYDGDSFYTADPDGFFIGTLNRSIIGCISAVNYGSFGFIGFYIIKPEFRGKGYGIKLWNTAMDYLKEVKCIGLDGVVDQQNNYMISGFKLEYRNIRYEGRTSNKKNKPGNLIELSNVSVVSLLKYDNKFFPAERKQFLHSWINQPKSKAIGYLEKAELKGYGVIRKCRTSYKIGPLFGDNKTIAEEIFLSLISSVEDDVPFYLDIPEINPDAIELVEKYSMKKVFETARMYKGEAPRLPVQNIFGVTTFELG